MNQKNLTITYDEYGNADELSTDESSLLKEAGAALKNAYAPYSDFHVGAALADEDGNIFIGCNMENASYPLCICAEGAMLTAYNTSGSASPIVQVAVTARSANHELNHPVAPCGACRQMLSEFEIRQGKNIRLILQGSSGPVFVLNSIKDILPLGFSGSDL